MSQTRAFIRRLEALDEGERSRLRRRAGMRLDETLPGFDLFTGLWWPLRQKNQFAPRRETSWLVAKLFGACPVPNVEATDTYLSVILGRCEPNRDREHSRLFRYRFDTLLQTSLSALEPHLRWSLSIIADAVHKGRTSGLHWAQLLDDLSAWDRDTGHRGRRGIRETWAEEYLNAAGYQLKGG